MAEAERERGDQLAALAHQIAAETLEAHAAGTLGDGAGGLCMVATGYFMKGEAQTAARWYELALAINPLLAIAHQNLAAIHASAGNLEQARLCRERAYRIQRIFIESAGNAARRVLVLCVGQTAGNIPVETLLPAETVCRIKYIFDFASAEDEAQLPPYDLVWNAIGEPDVAAPLQQRLEHFMQRCGRPLLNRPAAVMRTQRHKLPLLLSDLAGVVVAPCIRVAAPIRNEELGAQLAAAGIALPVLLRPLASHGGQGLQRCQSADELAQRLRAGDGPHYLTAFRDTANADGYYRKYRLIFIGGQPHAYHMAISRHWLVHYFSADMETTPWKIAEERQFLQAPAQVLGPRAWAAAQAIGQRLELDYAGIDFTVLADGSLFVFEANATMLVHRERESGPLAHKNIAVEQIVAAFEALQARRSAGAG